MRRVTRDVPINGGVGDALQEIVDHDPLIMPARQPRGAPEGIAFIRHPRHQRGRVHHLVVEADERLMELRDDDVLVVTRIADLGDTGLIAQVIVDRLDHAGRRRLDAGIAQLQLERRRVVQRYAASGAVAVDIVEIERRRAKVLDRVGILLLFADAGLVEREVVIDELTEIGIACGDQKVLIVVAGVEKLPVVHLDHRLGERPQIVGRYPGPT